MASTGRAANLASFSPNYDSLATAYRAAVEVLWERTEFAQSTANSLRLMPIVQVNDCRHAAIAETTTSAAEQQIGVHIRLVHRHMLPLRQRPGRQVQPGSPGMDPRFGLLDDIKKPSLIYQVSQS
jgi:hypothetical protein